MLNVKRKVNYTKIIDTTNILSSCLQVAWNLKLGIKCRIWVWTIKNFIPVNVNIWPVFTECSTTEDF